MEETRDFDYAGPTRTALISRFGIQILARDVRIQWADTRESRGGGGRLHTQFDAGDMVDYDTLADAR